MGHSRAGKAHTHARLVAAAAARFKERGIHGISVSDLMKGLKLTHGGFYKHFASRAELVSEALDLALAESGQSMRARLPDANGAGTAKFGAGVAKFVDFYLSEAHRDGRAAGCAVAALAGEAPRNGAKVQAQFRKQIERNLETLSKALAQRRPNADARAGALLLLSALYGALIMARAVGDSPLSKEILLSARKRLRTFEPGKSSTRAAKQPRRRAG